MLKLEPQVKYYIEVLRRSSKHKQNIRQQAVETKNYRCELRRESNKTHIYCTRTKLWKTWS